MNHRAGSIAFGLAIGLLVAVLSYQWLTDPSNRVARNKEVSVVELSRGILNDTLGIRDLQIVDALAPQRKVGKVYVYPLESGWEISGYYRRDDDDRWHPFLMALDSELSLRSLKVRDSDSSLAQRAATDPLLEVQ
jgi:hypothetical protein